MTSKPTDQPTTPAALCSICNQWEQSTLHDPQAFAADGAEIVAEFYGGAPWAVLHEFQAADETPAAVPDDVEVWFNAYLVRRGAKAGWYWRKTAEALDIAARGPFLTEAAAREDARRKV